MADFKWKLHFKSNNSHCSMAFYCYLSVETGLLKVAHFWRYTQIISQVKVANFTVQPEIMSLMTAFKPSTKLNHHNY